MQRIDWGVAAFCVGVLVMDGAVAFLFFKVAVFVWGFLQ